MIEIRINSEDIKELDSLESWWNEMTIDERVDFLNVKGWADIEWCKKEWERIPFVMKNWIKNKV